MFDVAIIGTGVIGTTIARELSKKAISVVMLERESDVSCGTTKANSAIIHAGFDAPASSNKGKYNAAGNPLFDQLCKELAVPFKRIGSLVLAFSEEELITLEELRVNGSSLGVPNLEIVDQARLREMEPHVSDEALAGLYAPSAGIIEPWELAMAAAENAVDNGVELKLNFEVTKIDRTEEGYFDIYAWGDKVSAKTVVNATGVYADQIYRMVNPNAEFSIHPRRGQYYLLDKTANGLVNHVLFPCPTKMGKGILVVPTIDGNVLIGPDSEDLDEQLKEAIETTGDRLTLIKKEAGKLCKEIPYRETITTFAGLRAEPTGGDFIVGESSIKHFFNVAGMKSPGLSSAPAIAKDISRMVCESLGEPEDNPDFNPVRRPRIKMAHMTEAEKQALIEQDPRFGRIICRCEMITEGEIVDAIHRSVGGRSLNGIKRRIRPGAGRCQGGFCGPRVMEILAKELHIDILDVVQEGPKSKLLISETKSSRG